MFRVISRGSVSVVLAAAALTSALPALAKEQGDGPPPHAQDAPAEQGKPSSPSERSGDESTTPSKPRPQGPVRSDRPVEEAPEEDAAQPEETQPADTQAPPATGRRLKRRSTDAPGVSEPAKQPERLVAPTQPADSAAPAPPSAQLIQPRGDGTSAPTTGARSGAGQRAAAREPAASRTPRPVAAAQSQSDEGAEPRPTEAEAPPQPLPGRLVPRPLRQIVEVVPTEVWAALGLLALLALFLGISSWLTARRAQRLQRQRAELLQEVGLLQAALLPSVPDGIPVSAAYRPAQGPGAGGDFYEAFALGDDRVGLILGEVAGDGRETLARTTLIRYTLRAYLEAGLEPREVVKVGSDTLGDHLGSGFASVTVAVHDAPTGRFTYASAGHAPPIVVGGEPHEAVTVCSAPPLGLGERTGFRQTTFTLTAGAAVCLYTDGVTESRLDGRLFGVERFERALAELPPEATAEELLDRVVATADEVTDDMAVCVLRAPDGAPDAGARIEELDVNEREVGDSLEHFLRACGVPLAEVPGILREAGEAARREGHATVRVRLNGFRPGVDVVPGNLVRLEERRRAARL